MKDRINFVQIANRTTTAKEHKITYFFSEIHKASENILQTLVWLDCAQYGFI